MVGRSGWRIAEAEGIHRQEHEVRRSWLSSVPCDDGGGVEKWKKRLPCDGCDSLGKSGSEVFRIQENGMDRLARVSSRSLCAALKGKCDSAPGKSRSENGRRGLVVCCFLRRSQTLESSATQIQVKPTPAFGHLPISSLLAPDKDGPRPVAKQVTFCITWGIDKITLLQRLSTGWG